MRLIYFFIMIMLFVPRSHTMEHIGTVSICTIDHARPIKIMQKDPANSGKIMSRFAVSQTNPIKQVNQSFLKRKKVCIDVTIQFSNCNDQLHCQLPLKLFKNHEDFKKKGETITFKVENIAAILQLDNSFDNIGSWYQQFCKH